MLSEQLQQARYETAARLVYAAWIKHVAYINYDRLHVLSDHNSSKTRSRCAARYTFPVCALPGKTRRE